MLFKRNLYLRLKDALSWSPVVLLTGPRQSGKTTLVKQLAEELNYSFITLDNISILAAAHEDMIGFIATLKKPVVIDEVQRIPELFLPIKQDVDQHRIKGRYILTGSANPLDMSNLGDSLSGRMLIFTLLPLSQGELNNRKERFIDTIFEPSFRPLTQETLIAWPNPKKDLCTRFINGGFPDVQQNSPQQRSAWFEAYLTTRLQRDVLDLARIEGLTALPLLISLFASRIGNLLNVAEISRSSKIANSTLQRYIALLKSLYLLDFIPPWHANLSKRLVKTPKLYFIDTGIASHLLGADEDLLMNKPDLFGSLLENFVANELSKQLTWHDKRIKLYHFRTSTGIEVDFILENAAGSIVGIEIKSSQTVKADDFKGLKALQELVGDRFIRGIVLYTGDMALSFGDKLVALPVATLWN